MKNNVGKPLSAKAIESRFSVIRDFIAIGIALFISFLLILSVSKEPLEAMKAFIIGPLSTVTRLGYIVEKTIPLLFTGTAVCIMFSCGQINLSGESTFYFSGVIAATCAIILPLPSGIHPIVCILAGGIAGAVICGLTAIFYTQFHSFTIVTSLMFNYVFLYLGQYIVNYKIWDSSAGYKASYLYSETSLLGHLFKETNIHSGLFIGIAAIVLGYLLLYRTGWGYSMRMIGLNAKFAEYSGINVTAYIIGSQLIGGFIAGIGGAVEQLGMFQRFQYSGLTGHGFDGVMIAVIAGLNPKYVPAAALFLAYIRVGAEVMSRTSDVPTEIVSIVQAVIIIFIAAERFLAGWKHRTIIKNSKLQAEAKGEKI